MTKSPHPFPISARMPLSIGCIHFVGIGGIGMSGIAELLHNLGYTVQGSDIAESYTVERLRKHDITVMIGAHKAENVKGAAAVVISSAVKADNPEVVEARANRIPVVRRAEMLAELMRLKAAISIAGTHGKTTTTSLISTLLMAADKKPTVINGGIINAYGTNAILGEGEWMVVEADESDGTFIRIPSTVAVVTNIDPEHLDHYGNFDALRAAFYQFITQLPFYGFAVMCVDHPEVQALMAKITDRRIISYGTSPQADVRAVNIRQIRDAQLFDVEITNPVTGVVAQMKDVHLPMYGLHNVRNALAAIAVAREIGIEDAAIVKGLRGFGGVKRRFTKTGEACGITIIDDYGHHPVEIAATLSSARQAVEGAAVGATHSVDLPLEGGGRISLDPPLKRDLGNPGEGDLPLVTPTRPFGSTSPLKGEVTRGRVIAVVQPHRYTRLSSLFNEFCTCFADADTVLVADVYSAGEEPIEGANRDALVEGIRAHGHKHVIALPSEKELAAMIADIAQPNDFVICLGAGSISKWAAHLPEELTAVLGKKSKASA